MLNQPVSEYTVIAVYVFDFQFVGDLQGCRSGHDARALATVKAGRIEADRAGLAGIDDRERVYVFVRPHRIHDVLEEQRSAQEGPGVVVGR